MTRVPAKRHLEKWLLTGITAGLTALVGWLWYQGESVTLGDSSLRILWQLIEGSLSGLVLLAGCILVFRKRAGVVLLHAGVGLMMANELLVYGLHSESMMFIQEHDTANYAVDLRATELAVIDHSPGDHDQVTVIPGSRLRDIDAAGKISSDQLPFDVKVVAYYRNSKIVAPKAPATTNPATAGAGLAWIAEDRPASTGTDMEGKVDQASAYVRLLDKESGRVLGTYLVSEHLRPQPIEVNGKTFDIALRLKRDYKPYTLRLDDVTAEMYKGTSIPKDYRSELRLIDPSREEDRPVKIWMNNPLRYAGETFYQSGYERNAKGEATKLSIVTNTGWMLPYVACMIVAVGMLAHFALTLSRFLRRRADRVPAATSTAVRPGRRTLASYAVPVCVVLAAAGWLMSKARVPQYTAEAEHLYAFGELPVMYEGRIKPLDTLARNSLRIISGRQTFLDDKDQSQPAIRWLLDVISHSDRAMAHKVFRIDNPEVLETLGLPERSTHRYAIVEFRERMNDLVKQLDVAQATEAARLSVYQRKLLELGKKLRLYMTLSAAFGERDLPSEANVPLAVPPDAAGNDWQPFADAIIAAVGRIQRHEAPNPATIALFGIFKADDTDDAAKFNELVAKYQTALVEAPPGGVDMKRLGFEAFFNHFEPFYYAAILYLAAFVLTALSWLGWSRPLNRAAFWLLVLVLGVHTFALVSRMFISGRPPVTNLYSSAVFIGWGCVVLGLIFESIFKLGIGNVVASVAGAATLGIAHLLAGDGDTFTVMQAVLDTQFWLATHVTCITLGYATTFVAGLLALLYVLRGFFTPSLTPDIGKELSRMIYGTLCFAIFFSFVGTVLGGLWADDSWGRFWGWDPKENGALIIVIWNALVLHARWGGLVKERGTAVLAVMGNVVTSWSWFGVNELGIGLHSYGFTEGVLLTLGLFVASQLAIVLLGSLPKRLWWSFRRAAAQ